MGLRGRAPRRPSARERAPRGAVWVFARRTLRAGPREGVPGGRGPYLNQNPPPRGLRRRGRPRTPVPP
eukprot:scaffold1938_cov399-Prasinococcus_capsulatus_cf.AAC.18